MTPITTTGIPMTTPPSNQTIDDATLSQAVRNVLDANPGLVRLHLAGKTAMGALIGRLLVHLSETPHGVADVSPARGLRAIRTELAARIPDYA